MLNNWQYERAENLSEEKKNTAAQVYDTIKETSMKSDLLEEMLSTICEEYLNIRTGYSSSRIRWSHAILEQKRFGSQVKNIPPLRADCCISIAQQTEETVPVCYRPGLQSSSFATAVQTPFNDSLINTGQFGIEVDLECFRACRTLTVLMGLEEGGSYQTMSM